MGEILFNRISTNRKRYGLPRLFSFQRAGSNLTPKGSRHTFNLSPSHVLGGNGGANGIGGGGGGGDEFNTVMFRWTAIRSKLLDHGCKENDLSEIEHAVWYAAQAFEGLKRKSGEPAVVHSLDVVEILLDRLRITDVRMLAGAALHDVPEDTYVTSQKIRKDFGEEMEALVSALTKFPKTHFEDQSVRYRVNRERLFRHMTEDVRVALIKLADRLANMRTLEYIKDGRDRERIAYETMEYFVPLANVLGIWELKRPLEDLSFKHIQPFRFEVIDSFMKSSLAVRESMAKTLEEELQLPLSLAGIKVIRFASKPRTVFGIHNEMRALTDKRKFRGPLKETLKAFADSRPLMDLDTFNIILENKGECKKAALALQNAFGPVYSRSNFIDSPKFNFYRSDNLTVFIRGFGLVNIKLRTEEMESVNDRGIAAIIFEQKVPLPEHWQKLIDFWRAGIDESTQTDRDLKKYLRPITVFTPENDPVVLSRGATALDFAFNLHTEIGLGAVGVKINGKEGYLVSRLEDGDIVEIVLEKGAPTPKREIWLRTMPSLEGEARRKIRRFLEKRPGLENIEFGREVLTSLFKRELGKKIDPLDPDREVDAAFIGAALFNLALRIKHIYKDPKTRPRRDINGLDDLYWCVGTFALDPKIVLNEFRKVFGRET